jgi:hypothetical protein
MIYSSLCNQFLMISTFDDSSALDYDDIICFFDGLKSMRDDDDRSVFE